MQCEFSKWIVPQGCWNIKVKCNCKKESIININGKNLCRHHARLGRFVIRKGDIGDILFRCDTEIELREEFSIAKYPQCRMQKITKSHRKDIF